MIPAPGCTLSFTIMERWTDSRKFSTISAAILYKCTQRERERDSHSHTQTLTLTLPVPNKDHII